MADEPTADVPRQEPYASLYDFLSDLHEQVDAFRADAPEHRIVTETLADLERTLVALALVVSLGSRIG